MQNHHQLKRVKFPRAVNCFSYGFLVCTGRLSGKGRDSVSCFYRKNFRINTDYYTRFVDWSYVQVKVALAESIAAGVTYGILWKYSSSVHFSQWRIFAMDSQGSLWWFARLSLNSETASMIDTNDAQHYKSIMIRNRGGIRMPKSRSPNFFR